MKKILTYLLSFSFLIVVYGFQSNIKDDEPAGKKIFLENRCASCHSVKAANIISKKELKKKKKKSKYPDLSDVGTKFNSEFITKWILKEETINGAKHMKTYKGSDEDLKVMVDWLMSLSKDDVIDTTKAMKDKVDKK